MVDEETRPFRMCDSCGGVDDHPRHVHSASTGDLPVSDEIAEKALQNAGKEHYREILSQVRDDSQFQKHVDCCAKDGCPTGSCNQFLAESKGAKGADLVKFLTSQPTPEED
jgi:hypothetical protein